MGNLALENDAAARAAHAGSCNHAAIRPPARLSSLMPRTRTTMEGTVQGCGHVYWSDACSRTGGLAQPVAHDRTCDERYRFISGSVRARVITRVEQSVRLN